MNKLRGLIKAGNHKLPRTTAIFNMGPATTCPSKKLGLCQAFTKEGKHVCYALRAEVQYPRALPYRKRQEKYWKKNSAERFIMDFLEIQSRKRNKFTAIRLNESGDFWTQDCIRKAELISRYLEGIDVKVYCYTARSDLDYSRVSSLVVMGSDFKKEGIAGVFKMIETRKERPKGFGTCAMDCRKCKRCIKGQNTVVMRH